MYNEKVRTESDLRQERDRKTGRLDTETPAEVNSDGEFSPYSSLEPLMNNAILTAVNGPKKSNDAASRQLKTSDRFFDAQNPKKNAKSSLKQ